MSISLKKDTTKTNIKHNNRTMGEREREKNKHIDYSRSHENKYLVQDSLKELYEKEFGKAQEDYNDKQKRADRKIKSYYDHIQGGKKTSLQQEMILQVGDKDDFENNPANVEMANEVLEEWFRDFEKRNPNLKIYNAVIHNDEASPHMHLNFVPVATGYKRGMDKQVSFDRAITQQDKTLDKVRPFDDWRNQEVFLLEKKLNERGIERELVGTNDYEDVNEYKEKKDLEKEIQLLEKNVVGKKKELIDLTEVIPDKKLVFKNLKKEIKTEVKPKFLGKPEIIEKETGNFVLTPKQLKSIEGTVNATVSVKKDYERLNTTDLVAENRRLDAQLNRMYLAQNKWEKEIKELKVENNTLRSSIGDLKDRVEALTIEVGSAYKGIKEYVREHTRDVRGFKNAFKDVMDIIKGESRSERDRSGFQSPVGEFEKTYNREKARERDRGLER